MLTSTDIKPQAIVQHWFEHSWQGVLIVFIAGALLPLAFSPVDFYLLAIISPAILFYALLHVASPRRALWLGWFFGLGYFGTGVSWVFVAVYVFGNSSIFTAALLTVISICFIAIYPGLQSFFSVYIIQKYQLKNKFLILVVVFPLTWVVIEWFRGWFLTGFPWLAIGYSQTNSFLAGYAPIIGVYGVSWIVVILAGLLLSTLIDAKKIPLALMSAAIIYIAGFLFMQLSWTDKTGNAIKVSLVQGNVDQSSKWDPEHFEKRKNRYLSLTREHWDSDLVLWPENALTLFYHDVKDDFLTPLGREAKKEHTDIILGLPVLNQKTREYYSSLVSIGSDEKFYHKNHLVPFGEFLPLASLLRGMIAFFDLPMSGFTPGEYQQNLLLAAGQKIAPTICYEDAFGEDLIRFLPEASLILNASNNAWYGDSFAPHQHLQISRMRALETGRDMMRVTTNGISALIDNKGKIIARSPQFKSYVVTGYVQPRQGATPYVRWGNLPVFIIVIFSLFMLFIYIRKNNG